MEESLNSTIPYVETSKEGTSTSDISGTSSFTRRSPRLASRKRVLDHSTPIRPEIKKKVLISSANISSGSSVIDDIIIEEDETQVSSSNTTVSDDTDQDDEEIDDESLYYHLLNAKITSRVKKLGKQYHEMFKDRTQKDKATEDLISLFFAIVGYRKKINFNVNESPTEIISKLFEKNDIDEWNTSKSKYTCVRKDGDITFQGKFKSFFTELLWIENNTNYSLFEFIDKMIEEFMNYGEVNIRLFSAHLLNETLYDLFKNMVNIRCDHNNKNKEYYLDDDDKHLCENCLTIKTFFHEFLQTFYDKFFTLIRDVRVEIVTLCLKKWKILIENFPGPVIRNDDRMSQTLTSFLLHKNVSIRTEVIKIFSLFADKLQSDYNAEGLFRVCFKDLYSSIFHDSVKIIVSAINTITTGCKAWGFTLILKKYKKSIYQRIFHKDLRVKNACKDFIISEFMSEDSNDTTEKFINLTSAYYSLKIEGRMAEYVNNIFCENICDWNTLIKILLNHKTIIENNNSNYNITVQIAELTACLVCLTCTNDAYFTNADVKESNVTLQIEVTNSFMANDSLRKLIRMFSKDENVLLHLFTICCYLYHEEDRLGYDSIIEESLLAIKNCSNIKTISRFSKFIIKFNTNENVKIFLTNLQHKVTKYLSVIKSQNYNENEVYEKVDKLSEKIAYISDDIQFMESISIYELFDCVVHTNCSNEFEETKIKILCNLMRAYITNVYTELASVSPNEDYKDVLKNKKIHEFFNLLFIVLDNYSDDYDLNLIVITTIEKINCCMKITVKLMEGKNSEILYRCINECYFSPLNNEVDITLSMIYLSTLCNIAHALPHHTLDLIAKKLAKVLFDPTMEAYHKKILNKLIVIPKSCCDTYGRIIATIITYVEPLSDVNASHLKEILQTLRGNLSSDTREPSIYAIHVYCSDLIFKDDLKSMKYFQVLCDSSKFLSNEHKNFLTRHITDKIKKIKNGGLNSELVNPLMNYLHSISTARSTLQGIKNILLGTVTRNEGENNKNTEISLQKINESLILNYDKNEAVTHDDAIAENVTNVTNDENVAAEPLAILDDLELEDDAVSVITSAHDLMEYLESQRNEDFIEYNEPRQELESSLSDTDDSISKYSESIGLFDDTDKEQQEDLTTEKLLETNDETEKPIAVVDIECSMEIINQDVNYNDIESSLLELNLNDKQVREIVGFTSPGIVSSETEAPDELFDSFTENNRDSLKLIKEDLLNKKTVDSSDTDGQVLFSSSDTTASPVNKTKSVKFMVDNVELTTKKTNNAIIDDIDESSNEYHDILYTSDELINLKRLIHDESESSNPSKKLKLELPLSPESVDVYYSPKSSPQPEPEEEDDDDIIEVYSKINNRFSTANIHSQAELKCLISSPSSGTQGDDEAEEVDDNITLSV